MKIGVLTAMSSEFEQLAKLLGGVERCVKGGIEYLTGTLDANEVILRQCGIGKVNAAVGTSELIRSFSPDIIVSTGVAGGIDKSLDVMYVVINRTSLQGIIENVVTCQNITSLWDTRKIDRAHLNELIKQRRIIEFRISNCMYFCRQNIEHRALAGPISTIEHCYPIKLDFG